MVLSLEGGGPLVGSFGSCFVVFNFLHILLHFLQIFFEYSLHFCCTFYLPLALLVMYSAISSLLSHCASTSRYSLCLLLRNNIP